MQMDIRRPGVFVFLDTMEGAKIVGFTREVERLGYSTMWIVEAAGRNSLALATWLLAKTNSLYRHRRSQYLGTSRKHDGRWCTRRG
jgi:hypothetical protein